MHGGSQNTKGLAVCILLLQACFPVAHQIGLHLFAWQTHSLANTVVLASDIVMNKYMEQQLTASLNAAMTAIPCIMQSCGWCDWPTWQPGIYTSCIQLSEINEQCRYIQ